MEWGTSSRTAAAAPSVLRDEQIRGWAIYGPLKTARESFSLAVRILRIAFTSPRSWIGEAISESDRYLRRTIVPLAISQAIWIIGFGVITFAAVAGSLGIADRYPWGTYTGYVREVSTWITLMIFAGVAGSALAADLGARKVREELDALSVLGVDQLRVLVVPRVMAMAFCSVVLGYLGLFVPMGVNWGLAPFNLDITHTLYGEAWWVGIFGIDLIALAVKHLIMGFFLGLVACQKGLATQGGAEGVGRTVAQTVIISFVGIWLINSIYNLSYVTLFPDLVAIRG